MLVYLPPFYRILRLDVRLLSLCSQNWNVRFIAGKINNDNDDNNNNYNKNNNNVFMLWIFTNLVHENPMYWKGKNAFNNRIKLRRDDFNFNYFHESRVTEQHTNTKRKTSSVSGISRILILANCTFHVSIHIEVHLCIPTPTVHEVYNITDLIENKIWPRSVLQETDRYRVCLHVDYIKSILLLRIANSVT